MAKKTFETSIKELEQIVSDLESGELDLETALKKFEEGVRLSKSCTRILDETEKRVTLLMEDAAGNLTEQPLETGDDRENDRD